MPFAWKFPPEYNRKSKQVLDTALEHLPAYRSWRTHDPGRSRPVDARYNAMPILTKQDIRLNFPDGFVPPGKDIKKGIDSGEIGYVQTSGTSDAKVTNLWNQQWWDASEKASWKLNMHAHTLASGNHHEAILVSPLNVGFPSDKVDLPMQKRRLSRFLYLNERTSTAMWSAAHMDRMIKELGVFKPAVLEANPSLLSKLCRYAIATGKEVYQPGLIVFTYEYPAGFHYRQIRQVFNSPVASSYGSTETGYVFMQCEAGRFHQNTGFCRVDFQPMKPEHGGPTLGRILVTTLDNPWYYILRFDVNDLVRLDKSGGCPCGRNEGYILSGIEGRSSNVTLTCEGRLVTLKELDDAMTCLEGIDEYRLEQQQRDKYAVLIVSQRLDKGQLYIETVDALKGLYGHQSDISVTFQDAILPETSGKYKLAGATFPIDIESYLEPR